jgi:serine/threonine protein kinase
MPLAAGTRIGHLEIMGLIGEGGMGEVYRARDSKLNRHVAWKIAWQICEALEAVEKKNRLIPCHQ